MRAGLIVLVTIVFTPSSPAQFRDATGDPINAQPQAPALSTVAQIEPFGSTPGSGAPEEKQVRIVPRSSVPIQFDFFPAPDGSGRVAVINSGAVIIIDGVDALGRVEIATDRLVIWTSGDLNALSGEGGLPSGDAVGPVEFYLEGNVVFRQADRVIQAASMYYNVATDQGVILNAELLSPIPDYQGLVRLKAAVLRQLDRSRFEALGAAVTSSRLGVPRYWFQSENLSFVDTTQPGVATLPDGLGGAVAVPGIAGERRATSRNNFIYVGGVPVFYWPFLTTDFTRPTNYINRVRFGSDRVFGRQLGIGLDLDQILGVSGRFPGVNTSVSLDYLSERGFGFGGNVQYELPQLFGVSGPAMGFIDAWGINEEGFDNLGLDRRMLTPEEEFRGRVLGRHRQRTDLGWQITGELGYLTDRNFLEQYYEREWDQEKDQVTGIEFKRLFDNSSFNVAGYFQLNEFFTQTEWLPRVDYFQLGQPLFQDQVTWLSHSHAGYAKLEPATRPLDPVDAAKFNPLAWEAEREGIRVGTRNELDFPVQLGGVKVVPYVLGEVMHWGETLTGDEATRLFGQAGIRTSLPMWRVDPGVQNVFFNLNGLAHKVVFEAEFLYADADQNLDTLPLYDPLDDDSQEHFRRRFVDDTFFGLPNVDDLVPLKFDERFFAFRSGMQSWVTAPSAEIVDDLMLLKLGARQRWQTKRGVPGRYRVVDWMTFDVGASIFPEADRDNFGSAAGLLNYDWRWHLGDRFTLTSDGFADVFGDGLRTVTIGGYTSRPERGSLYLGLRSIEGPISSTLLNGAVNYRLSPKWIGTLGTVVDLGNTGNIGQVFEITRIGESFLVSVGAYVDSGRDNVGFGISIEPRFLPVSYRGRVGGVPIPPAGALGLE